MRVVVIRSSRDACEAVARHIAAVIRQTPNLVLGLPTGRTPILVYDALADLYDRGRVDFSRVTTFNLDELEGLRRGDPRSYHAFMRRHLFDRVNLLPRRRFIPNGAARDPHREAARYESQIERAGGLDLCLLGIGRNGHLGFNEPAAALDARTHRARLRPETRRSNAYLFDGRWREVPAHAVSMGIGTILGARSIVLLATGKEKASIVAGALNGRVTTQLPASLLQGHPNVVVVLDRDAAARLEAL
jgi:glucosamine-6-phosphate deaminase